MTADKITPATRAKLQKVVHAAMSNLSPEQRDMVQALAQRDIAVAALRKVAAGSNNARADAQLALDLIDGNVRQNSTMKGKRKK